MSTILTDDERTAIIQAADSNTEALSSSDMRLVELTEVAVLAKLAQQEAVAVFRTDSNWGHVDLLAHCGPPMVDGQRLYTHPAPQADRQRVPEGYVLVPVEPTDEMVDAACDKSDFFRVDFVLAWDAAINASPELTQSATSHTHKVVPVTPTKEMLISGARAPVELLSPDGALQVYRAMLAAAPEAPAQADRQRVPDGWKLVPAWKGYALLGTGNYVINHSADFDPELGAELIITLATDKDREGNRQIGESRPTQNPGDPIQADDMVIRIGFLNERGLFALEDQLAEIRKLHFAAPEAPAQAGAVDDDYKVWYCAQCQRGVDGSEVTFHEQHEACGRVITDDRPPKAQASAVDERDRKDADRYRWLRDALVSDDPYGLLEQAFGHSDKDEKPTAQDFDACISAALAQKGGK